MKENERGKSTQRVVRHTQVRQILIVVFKEATYKQR
jgi:hypothetical protein